MGDMYELLKTGEPNIANKKTLVDTVNTEMDEDCDGEISESELIQSCLGQHKISKLLALKIIDILGGDQRGIWSLHFFRQSTLETLEKDPLQMGGVKIEHNEQEQYLGDLIHEKGYNESITALQQN